MKPEQKVWRRLRTILQSVSELEYERIESRVSGIGVPDVYCAHSAVGAFWLEMKADQSLDRSMLNFPLGANGWRVDQRRWARKSWQVGVPVYLVIGKFVDGNPDGVYIVDTRVADGFTGMPFTDKRIKPCSFVIELCGNGTRNAGGK